jgi:2-polyprenyl-3-methyl-5-hydroxy-6-metoxy-1,4-benzoquinol methylase
MCGKQGVILYQGVKDRLFGTPGEWNFKKCPDPRCGLVWLDPMPIEEEIGLVYRNYYTHQDIERFSKTWPRRTYDLVKEGYLAHKYDYCSASVSTWKKLLGMLMYLHPGRRADVDFSIMYLPANLKGSLLEVGCGNGNILKRLQKMCWQVEGVDFDPSAVENARSKGLQVHFGTLENQNYPNDHFDVIFMSHLIEHVHDPLRILRESYRILSPGGQMVLVTPNNASLGHTLFKEAWRGLEVPRHLYLFTLKTLRELTKNAGFHVKQVKITVRNARGIYLASRSIQKATKEGRAQASVPDPNIQAEIWQFMEWIMCKLNPNLGEELIVFAGKQVDLYPFGR